MKLIKVIPNIFYTDIKIGLDLFVDALGFKIMYSDADKLPFCIIDRDGVTLYLTEDDEFAKKDRPQIRIETDGIETLYQEVKDKNRALFHPNLSTIKTQPWGLKEFALLDKSGVCVIIYEKSTT